MSLRRVGVLAACCAAVPVALAAAGGVKDSKVTIDDYHSTSTHAVFEGEVRSPHGPCKRQRRVKVIGNDIDGGGRRVLGRDVTGADGRYKVREAIPFFEDSAWARIKSLQAGNGARCRGDKSREISTAG
jgi:hypothetical protein